MPFLFPYFFVLLLPANFIVDTVMLLLLFFLFKVPEKKGALPEGHLESMGLWISGGFSGGRGSGHHQQCGFAAISYICAVFLCGAFLFATVGVVLAGVLIYFFHIKFVWKGILLEEGKKKKIALGMAILTAPYLMYLSPL